MAIKFAKRMDGLKGSEIRELLKLTEKPEVISFAGGLPAPELFPVEEMKEISRLVLEESGKEALQYTTTEGFGPLREQIAERMNRKLKTDISKDDLIITSGSQQGLDFAGKIFLNEGDVVLVESPSYLGALNAFKSYCPTFIEVPTDNNGMIIEELEKILESTENVKMIYVIPDFQNPTGKTWSMERRNKFMDVINKFEIPVVEDNPYGELRFEGEVLPSLKSMDEKGLVIFLGSFSKIFCPGYRIGWVCASPQILSKFVFVKQGADLQASTISQREVSKFIEVYDLDAHVEKIKTVYKKRRDLMLSTIKEYFPEGIEYTHPEGGLFTWIELPSHLDARKIMEKCLENNVAYVPGGSFFPNGGKENTFRLNYSNMPDEKIVEGVKRLAEALNEALLENANI
ncbi:2-aminoadipate transaminase [uncultured Clostridium sp.]|uniref:PLP-dependent aminotransferase family protein n=1 Tax=Paeniclostridium hominis TaxID=2764329 RepID=A0ABR7K673_9FIRM|nr:MULTISPECIES: PLP-dependent aminotransferase family protein [Paeniclostridium]MDU1540252.1 PLP-dependent aminotransferase family protein [Paeniclostridium sordellii]SCJ40116.1 2-aminoadipate transaminase [uncultured Clostridium sp.]MBC6004599.1 PLP-dependent aminotransferase family protein [Paeniclostridium hominis]MDU2591577.1 PLP-dependent aminotransferase family protein [Paeniclostridium sordellii]SCJ41070.1 2-aminoadipate transaminase [uncultured Clostridium sp.]